MQSMTKKTLLTVLLITLLVNKTKQAECINDDGTPKNKTESSIKYKCSEVATATEAENEICKKANLIYVYKDNEDCCCLKVNLI